MHLLICSWGTQLATVSSFDQQAPHQKKGWVDTTYEQIDCLLTCLGPEAKTGPR